MTGIGIVVLADGEGAKGPENPRLLKRLLRALSVVGFLASFGGLALPLTSSATIAPSGEVTIGNSTLSSPTGPFTGGGGSVEPAYNDANGSLAYIFTPTKSQIINPKTQTVAPIYVVVYPVGSGIDPTSLDCRHLLADLVTLSDNCPDHGPLVAGHAIVSPVYGHGVLGHDHLIGVASTGGDFNFIWEPVLVLFTNAAAATEHITTLNALNEAVADHDAIEIPVPALDFNCSVVSASVYANGTPVTPFTG